MFANFKKAFKRDESNNKTIPQAILDAMSDSLPQGLKYTQVDKEYCRVVPEEGELSFEFAKLNVTVPNDVKLANAKELTEFLYRTQQELHATSSEITVNGKNIKISELVKNPYRDIDTESCKLTITPEPFGDPFPLKVEINKVGIVKEFLIERQPLADMHKSLFKSINDNVLEIKFTVDETHRALNFNVNIDIKKAKSILEIIDSFKMYIAFIEGEITIDGMQLNPVPNEKEKSAAGDALEYWNRVQSVAEKLDVQFQANEGKDEENIEWIAKLYRSFVENKPYKQRSGNARFTIDSQGEWDENELLEKSAMALQYTLNEEIKVYGVNIPLYSTVALLNCKVESILQVEGPNKKYEFKVIPADNKGIYQAARHFIAKENFDKLYKDMGEVLEELSNAEEL